MGSMDIIKEYLVSLGFQVDNKSFSDTNKAIDSVGKSASKMTGEVVGGFLKAGLGITAFVATAVTGIAKFISSLGQAQIQNEIFARRMWTTQDSAMALNSTLKAMGVTLQDLYLSPTLMAQFQKLNQEARSLQAPSEYKDQMKFIQSITFEFTRMKLEATYSLQWIGYYFIKYMAGPLGQVKNVLDNVNNIIVKTMPTWTRIIAIGLVDVIKFGQTIWWALTQVGSFIKKLSDSMPSGIKIIAGALMLLSSPIGIIIAGLLLLQDYLTYKNGGKSVFKDLWEDTDNFIQKLEDNGAITTFNKIMSDLGKTLSDLQDTLGAIGSDFVNLSEDLAKALGFKSFNDFLAQTLLVTLSDIDNVIKSIDDGLKAIGKLAKGDVMGAMDELMKDPTKPDTPNNSNRFSKSMDRWIHGDFKGLWESSDIYGLLHPQSSQQSLNKSPMSYMYPQTSNANNHITNTLNQTNHIYGSSSNNTVDAIKTGAKDIVRNWQGVMI